MVLNIVLWGAFFLLAVAALVLALQLVGVIDLIDDDQSESEEVPSAIEDHIVEEEDLDELPEEEEGGLSPRVQAEVDRLLESAHDDMESNRLASAIDRLERARDLDPERIELYEMKAEVHEELGEADRADELRERAAELRELEEGDDGALLDEDEAEAAEEDDE